MLPMTLSMWIKKVLTYTDLKHFSNCLTASENIKRILMVNKVFLACSFEFMEVFVV